MQDKTLDAMAKRYKEEMMRLYCRKPEENTKPEHTPVPLPLAEEKQSALSAPSTQSAPPKPPAELLQMEKELTSEYRDRLMHPPMPEIPQSAREKSRSVVTAAQKFPSADDILAELPKFDSGQGNYEFTENSGGESDPEYQKEMQDFNAETEVGTGFLQIEIACEKGDPVDGALAAVTLCDALIATLFSGADGVTEAAELPVPQNGEKYAVTVYKEGFFTVHNLDVPVFSGIKSIQPVTMTYAK